MKNVSVYAKPHGTGNSNNGGGSGSASYNITKIVNNITNVNNTNVPQDLNIKNINSDKGFFVNLSGDKLYITNGNITYLITSEGTINKLSGNEITYVVGNIADLFAENISTNKLSVNDTATIKQIVSKILSSEEITTDYLTVNKSAHFFELIVDKLQSIKGTQLNTAANCVIDYVEELSAGYKVYWRTDNNNGVNITNDWQVYDQALCETYNITNGTTPENSNKYYWRLVTETDGGVKKYINLDSGQIWSESTPPVPNTSIIRFTNYVVVEGQDQFFIYTGSTPDVFFDKESVIYGEWDGSATWNAHSTLNGLILTPYQIRNDNEKITPQMVGGFLDFYTVDPTRINVTTYYDDGTIQYDEAPSGYVEAYRIYFKDSASIKYLLLTTAVIDKWDACNWIVLSKTMCDSPISGKSDVPAAGDNIAQLGYRYNMLPDFEDTETWYNNHQTEVARASAIITSAYGTPDKGGTYNGITYPPIQPPSDVQYARINDFNLFLHRQNVVSYGLNEFRGNFKTTAGQDLVEMINNVSFEKTETIDATALDATKCYPVVIHFRHSNGQPYNGSEIITCGVKRTLAADYGVPSYASHQNGFVTNLIWNTRAGGWGTNDVNQVWGISDKTRFISAYELYWAWDTDKIVGSIGQVIQISSEVVYVRGGSKYDISTSHKDSAIVLYAEGYSWSGGGESDSRPVINYEDLVIPVQDTMTRSEIVQTADNIQLNVYNELNQKTGINVTTGTITLDGDKTTITGDLDIKGLTTENVTIIERETYKPTVINMGLIGDEDTDDTHKIKSVQVKAGDDVHIVCLPFYDESWTTWSEDTDITFGTDGSFELYPQDLNDGLPEDQNIPLWKRKIVPWKENGTRITISNEVNYKYRNWKTILDYSSDSLKTTDANKLHGLVIVCADARLICYENLRSTTKQFNPSNKSGQISSQPDVHAGCFSCDGYISRFIVLAPGQTLQLRSQIVQLNSVQSGNREVLIWNVENGDEFKPLDENALYQFDYSTDEYIIYKFLNKPSFNPEDSLHGQIECICAPEVINYQTATNSGKIFVTQLYFKE